MAQSDGKQRAREGKLEDARIPHALEALARQLAHTRRHDTLALAIIVAVGLSGELFEVRHPRGLVDVRLERE